MPQILILTDRPLEDEQIVYPVAEWADRLGADGVAAVVTHHVDAVFPIALSFGIPDAVLLPQQVLPWLLLMEDNNVAAAEHWFGRCRHAAALHGLNCETMFARTSLSRTVVTLGGVAGLVVISRETTLNQDERALLRALRSEVAAPFLIRPTDATSWKRIVVATIAHQHTLLAWGGHWSRQFDVPLATIELRSPTRRSGWSAVTHWLPRSYPQHCREILREGLLAYGLGPSDLLLINRQPAVWQFPTNACEVALDDLVAAAPCSLGVAPISSITDTQELLYPEGLNYENESALRIVAA